MNINSANMSLKSKVAGLQINSHILTNKAIDMNTKKQNDLIPDDATHIDNGPSIVKFLRIQQHIHDYWCAAEKRWVTFEGGHNRLRDHWTPII